MNSGLLVVAIILAVLLLWLITQIAQSQKKSSALESQLTELRRDLLSVAQTQSQSAGQIQSIGTTVSQRLESVTKALSDGVTNSAHIATQGQTAIAAELKNTREQILQLQEQIGAVHEQSRGLSLATQSIENILGGTKTRGLLGDVALMFVPSENVYCEMLNTLDNKGQAIDAYCRDRKIVAVSPNTLYANLCVIAMGMRGM